MQRKFLLNILSFFRRYDYRLWVLTFGWFISAMGFAMVIPFLKVIFNNQEVVTERMDFELSSDYLMNTLNFYIGEIMARHDAAGALVLVSILVVISSLLKNGFAFDCVPTSHYGANSAWQMLSVLAFNLMKSFQVATIASTRSRSRKRRTVYGLEMIQTQRFTWINRAGCLIFPAGRLTLDVGTSPEVKNRFIQISERLAEAA